MELNHLDNWEAYEAEKLLKKVLELLNEAEEEYELQDDSDLAHAWVHLSNLIKRLLAYQKEVA